MRVLWYLIKRWNGADDIINVARTAVERDHYLVKGTIVNKFSALTEKAHIPDEYAFVFLAKDFTTLELGLKTYAQMRHEVLFVGNPQIHLQYGKYGDASGPTSALKIFFASKKFEKVNAQKVQYVKAVLASEPQQRGRSGAKAPAWTHEYDDLHNQPGGSVSFSDAITLSKMAKANKNPDKLAEQGVYVRVGTSRSGGENRHNEEIPGDGMISGILSMTDLATWISWKKTKNKDNAK